MALDEPSVIIDVSAGAPSAILGEWVLSELDAIATLAAVERVAGFSCRDTRNRACLGQTVVYVTFL